MIVVVAGSVVRSRFFVNYMIFSIRFFINLSRTRSGVRLQRV